MVELINNFILPFLLSKFLGTKNLTEALESTVKVPSPVNYSDIFCLLPFSLDFPADSADSNGKSVFFLENLKLIFY